MQIVPPGQYSLCIQPDNPEANVTFPLEAKKAYLSWVDFESSVKNLNFGIQNPADQDDQESPSSPEQNQPQPSEPESPENGEESEGDEDAEELPPQEVNALYERLLQEMESKSEPLQQEVRVIDSKANGRDY